MSVINGRRGAFLQPTNYGEDDTGFYTIFTWQGTKEEVLQNVPFIRGAGGTYDIQESPTNAACVLRARFPLNFGTPEQPVDTWELVGVESEKDILESDIAAIDSYSQDDISKLRKYIMNPQDDPAVIKPFSSAAQAAGISNMFYLMSIGLKTIDVSVPTLRHTQTVSRSWTIPAALTNVQRIYSTSSLISQEQVPGSLLFNLPTQVNPTRASAGFKYGWKKKYPTVRIAARQKAQIEQEWVYGLWPFSPAIYGALL